uniref:Serine protease n=1 Tax=Neogobius melanostomus TaxID=47308 RepID=A0A8C6UAL9_9GOBI
MFVLQVHSHKFILKFKNSEDRYTIQCDYPQTVLQAITSKREIQKKIKREEDKIIVQKGEARLGTAIATHFPCTRLKDGELVTLEMKNETVEVRDKERNYTGDANERYYVVNIQTKGGINTRSKTLLRSSLMAKFSLLCVYGTEDMTLKEAIKQDGRFVELGDFKLEYLTKGKMYVLSEDKIKQHDEKAGETVDPSEAGPSTAWAKATLNDMPPLRWVPVSEVLKKETTKHALSVNKEILELLRSQFPELKRQLESRYQDTLKKVNFGKAQQAFSDVFRLEKLLDLGKSVCKITISNTCEGTGFVLFQRYVLTNAHLFDAVIYNNSVQPDLHTTAKFNYKEPHQQNTLDFKVNNTFIDYDRELDYAVLELVVSDEDEGPVPPGLMKHCCPMPESGEACIIGHPNGGIQKFDPTCIIEKERRQEEVDKHLQQFSNDISVFSSVRDYIQKQGIERILCPPEPLFHKAASYHTFMFHGSSGSPVFDSHCRVFGLHTGGYTYDLPTKGSVIEFGRPGRTELSAPVYFIWCRTLYYSLFSPYHY